MMNEAHIASFQLSYGNSRTSQGHRQSRTL